MKKRLFLVFVAIAITLGMSSCTTISKLNAITDSATLNSANFEYVKTVKESASSTYIFGLFGGTPEQMAIQKVRETAALQPNQALTNYSVTTASRIVLGIVIVKTATATADVVQFN